MRYYKDIITIPSFRLSLLWARHLWHWRILASSFHGIAQSLLVGFSSLITQKYQDNDHRLLLLYLSFAYVYLCYIHNPCKCIQIWCWSHMNEKNLWKAALEISTWLSKSNVSKKDHDHHHHYLLWSKKLPHGIIRESSYHEDDKPYRVPWLKELYVHFFYLLLYSLRTYLLF